MNGVCPGLKDMYVVVEGLDFSGKSTLIKQLKDILGWETVSEPYTGNEHAKEIKSMNARNYLPKQYEMMMMIASRIDCFDEVVDDHRFTGLISDRCVLSSMVYQETDSFTQRDIFLLNKKALSMAGHNVLPDKIVFVDIDHATFLERLQNCNRPIDAKDKWLKDINNWNLMCNRYATALDIMIEQGVDVRIINQTYTAEQVAKMILE